METLPLFAVILYFIGASNAAVLEGACQTNSDCTVTNSYCMKEFSECTHGKCKCSAGYSSDGSACKVLKAYNVACSTSTDICPSTLSCSGSPLKCICASTDTYNTNLQKCITTGLKEIGGTCTDVSNCYVGSEAGSVECVAATGATQKYCRCKSGYSTKNFMCVKPYLNEACSGSYGCRPSDGSSGDSSINDPSCTSSTCSCPSSNTVLTGTYNGQAYQMCLAPFSGTVVAAGGACTASNQCATKACQECPESVSTKKCVTLTASYAVKVTGSILATLLGVATVLLNYRG